MNDRQFYCICCKTLVPLEDAKQIFQTGYYKCIYRLGQCKACQSEENNLHLSIHPGMEEMYPAMKLEGAV